MFLRICQISLLLSTSIVFLSCSGTGGSPSYNPDIGPFDEDGNYVEAWADNPPKRGSSLRTTNPKPDPKPEPKKEWKPAPRVVAKAEPAPKPVVRPVAPPKPVYKPAPRPVVTTPKPVVTKPKPVVAKPKPKPKPVVRKPKSIRHTVKKGDTLFGLSKRYGVSISAIKRANGISGTTIITGKSYTIPR